MKLSHWKGTQLIILRIYSTALFVGLILVLGKPNNIFLRNHILNDWEDIKTEKLRYENETIAGKRISLAEQRNLIAEVYAIPNSNGESSIFMQKYLDFEFDSEEVRKSSNNTGSYSLLTHQNRVYLNTCIHTSGQTAINPQEFSQLANHNLSRRILPWVFGLADLRDWGCLWVNLSVSLDDITEQEASQLLQKNLSALVAKIK